MINRVINGIKKLGLTVVTDKTEAILFHGRGIGGLPGSINIGDIIVEFSPSIRYLGVMVDVHWTFSHHFRYVMNKSISYD